MMDEPLIYTTLGNVPVSSLKYEWGWEDTPTYVKFKERYLHNGVVVKENAHVLPRVGLTAAGETAQLG